MYTRFLSITGFARLPFHWAEFRLGPYSTLAVDDAEARRLNLPNLLDGQYRACSAVYVLCVSVDDPQLVLRFCARRSGFKDGFGTPLALSFDFFQLFVR